MNEYVTSFLQEIEEMGYSFYIFYRSREKQWLLDIRGNKINSNLSGRDLTSLVDTQKEVLGMKAAPNKIASGIDNFL